VWGCRGTRRSLRRDIRSAKEVRFSTDARERMLRGVDIFSNAVKITLGPKDRNVQILWRAAHDQGRRHRRQGNWLRVPPYGCLRRGNLVRQQHRSHPRGIAMNSFDYCAGAELLINKSKRSRRGPVGYKRFARAADTIRFLIEGLDRREPRPTPSPPEQGTGQSEASPAARKPLWWSGS
jgi:hypothetical protein